jgi:DNA adenine methylase
LYYNYIKSPMNYTGGKYKILHHIIPSFPSQMHNFVDLFAGGFNVGINVNAKTIYANDQITYLIELYRFFQDTGTDTLLTLIKERISQYDLSLTNSEAYYQFRTNYNKAPTALDLFVLTCFSFNHQIRFNSKHEFNTPFGKERSSYNDSIEYNLVRFCDALHKKNVVFSANDFRSFDFSMLDTGDVVYCDPPYLITTGSYNDGKRGFRDWTEEEDSALLQLLDMLDKRGILFALSNVFIHKGQSNDRLIEWSKKYYVSYIDKSYANCSYQFKDRETKTVEVLVTNYEWSGSEWKQLSMNLL